MTTFIGTMVHVALPENYTSHIGDCRPAIICEVMSDQYVYAHLFVSPSDFEELPLTDAHTRVPHWVGIHDPRGVPNTWHFAHECPAYLERAKAGDDH